MEKCWRKRIAGVNGGTNASEERERSDEENMSMSWGALKEAERHEEVTGTRVDVEIFTDGSGKDTGRSRREQGMECM